MLLELSDAGRALDSDVRGEGQPDESVLATARMRMVYAEHSDALFRFLLRLSWGERQLAEDLLQETMLQAWRHFDRLPTSWESTRRWLFIVARRIAIDAARARQARPVEVGLQDIGDLPANDDITDSVVAAQTIRRAMPKLTPAHRAVLIELYHRGRSTGEAARRLGIPEGTVKSRAYYALRALRAAIGRTTVD
ncbi:RNA polymerase sigma-70 factor (ECF subfamily) [Micromonospora violae]|uniref:RNA polymerase sigma-70 factor (ECF subfamily) n=1 Tax=Micromonospora violae TaxID=1278207 RepID=A0A4Q7UE41_9ACTN|nr:sigma-70 family RNA polymerase sigma factor [Micromonospora violae]RZT79465.1 RNA polymerase sigma-70 factor (ECF subfamily) [Micromonospora violae]